MKINFKTLIFTPGSGRGIVHFGRFYRSGLSFLKTPTNHASRPRSGHNQRREHFNFIARTNILTISAEMRGPGDSKVSTLTVLKRFSEEENPDEEPDTHVSKRHLITPFRDINANKRCSFLETFHRLRMPSLFLSISKSENPGPGNQDVFSENVPRKRDFDPPKNRIACSVLAFHFLKSIKAN